MTRASSSSIANAPTGTVVVSPSPRGGAAISVGQGASTSTSRLPSAPIRTSTGPSGPPSATRNGRLSRSSFANATPSNGSRSDTDDAVAYPAAASASRAPSLTSTPVYAGFGVGSSSNACSSAFASVPSPAPSSTSGSGSVSPSANHASTIASRTQWANTNGWTCGLVTKWPRAPTGGASKNPPGPYRASSMYSSNPIGPWSAIAA